jgi:serine-type D-Ala-D-Ala carboxypeptidase (penicillin-binding protein 5/6)
MSALHQARRNPRKGTGGRRQAGLALVTIVIAAVALLTFMAARASGPASHPFRAVVTAAQRHTSYGYVITLPQSDAQVAVHLNLPLRSGLLFDVRTGRALWARDPGRVLAMASLTKMMTALIVAAKAKPTDRVLITPAAVHFTGSGVGLLPLGKRVPLLALLYGLLLPSGNDAAIALAQRVARTQDHFIAMMNARAREMGLLCTHFTSVSGIVDQGNHSCATDLAILAHALLEKPLLAKIVGSRSAVLPFPIKGGKLYLYNNNPLLVLGYPGVDGVKTGYTTAAGQCLVAAARRGRTWLGVVLLHSGDPADQARKLLNAGFAAESRP